MTTFLLVRHADHDAVGRSLAGRLPGTRLNADGGRRAAALAQRLAPLQVTRVYSSPMERARETAEPIAERCGVPVELAEALTEIDFGEWTGRSFEDLAADPRWAAFNAYRSGTRAPGGESMLEVQARAVGALERLRTEHPSGVVIVVSHGDVLRAALAYYAGIPIDLLQRFEVGPGSVSTLMLLEDGARIVRINDTGVLP